jgi:hypothetical protein
VPKSLAILAMRYDRTLKKASGMVQDDLATMQNAADIQNVLLRRWLPVLGFIACLTIDCFSKSSVRGEGERGLGYAR